MEQRGYILFEDAQAQRVANSLWYQYMWANMRRDTDEDLPKEIGDETNSFVAE